jgi:hypothetical protein
MEDGFTIRNNHVQYVKLNKGMFLGGIMLSFIKQYKYALLIALLVFTPTSAVVFGLFGFLSGFVNWGFVVLIGIVVLGVKLNNKFDLRAMLSSQSDEEDSFI